jgi:putative phosphoesterase
MRIAVLADIHGNDLALQAVIDDIGQRGSFDAIIDCGDCVSGPLWPRETIERLTDLKAITVRGNHDRVVGTGDRANMGPSDSHAFDALTLAQRHHLGVLPVKLNVTEQITVFHATPLHDETYLTDRVLDGQLIENTIDEMTKATSSIKTKVLICGHSHRAHLFELPDRQWILNPGSVGCPAYHDPSMPAHVSESGTPHARYAILTLRNGSPPHVEIIALPYDNEAAARRAAANDRPDWAYALRTGRMPK